eukprot:gene17123-8647_t
MAGHGDTQSSWRRWHNDDADYILSCVTKEDLTSLKRLFKQKLGNPGSIFDRFGRNSLHIAVSCGKYDIAEWLINECAVDIQARDFESGWNALHRSLYYGNIQCAILVLKKGLDFSIQDKDGVSPLKIVLLDSQRTKAFKDDHLKLCRVILPYHASEPGELSLEIDELVDIIKEYKSTGWGFGRKTGTKEKGKFPLNFVAILGEKSSEFSDDAFTDKGHKSDVYSWGNNSNLTLGLGDTRNRDVPELVKGLHSQRYSVKEVAVSKYHTIFLTEDGTVLSCGQGRGGRLGHGNEQTVLSPQKIAGLNGMFCTAVSNANDHSLVLDQMGQVYSFGLNAYHQLGHYPVSQQYLTPKQISNKILKGKIMTGVAAARFHSAIHTKDELFTFGLNAGQLGHLKGDEWQSTPRLVTRLCKKDYQIELVTVSDGATCCLLSNGDVFVLQDYECRRIATRMANIKRLVMVGGELKSKALADLQHNQPDSLCVAALTTHGIVSCWRPGYTNFKECWWAGKKRDEWQIVDVCLGKHLVIATDSGIVFHGHFRNISNNLTAKLSPEGGKSGLSKSPMKCSLSIQELVEKVKRRSEDNEEVMIERVPLLYRAYRVACDVKSRTFAVIQNDPGIGLNSVVSLRSGTLEDDLERMLGEAELFDNIHDVVIKASDGMLPAHRFIIASKIKESDFESRLNFDGNIGKYVLDLTKIDMETVKSWLIDVYRNTKSTVLEPDDYGKILQKARDMPGDKKDSSINGCFYDQADKMVVQSMQRFCLQDLENPDFEGSRIVCGENGELVQELPAPRKQKKKKGKENKHEEKDKRRALFSAIIVLPGKPKITESKSQRASCYTVRQQQHEALVFQPLSLRIKHNKAVGQINRGFANWQQMGSISDIKIEAENGSIFHCHKCILVSRLDYFQGMLGNPWMESNWAHSTIKMPIPENILKIILDFVYIGEANNLKATCCPIKGDMRIFPCQTKNLDTLPVDALSDLSNVYKSLIPNMAYRRITPLMDHVEVDLVDEAAAAFPVETDAFHEDSKHDVVSPRDKADSAKKRRRRRKSSSTKEDRSSEVTVHNEGSTVPINSEKTVNVSKDLPVSSIKDKYANGTVGSDKTHDVTQRILEDQQAENLKPAQIAKSPTRGMLSLKEIMEEEEKNSLNKLNQRALKQTSKLERSPVEASISLPIKWEMSKKKSQRQRKEATKVNGNLNPTADNTPIMEEATQTKDPICPWGKPEQSQVRSFKDVMSEESKMELTRKSLQSGGERKPVEEVRRKLSWKKGSDENHEFGKRPSTESAWNMTSLATSPPSSAMSLSAIMKSQIVERDSSTRMLKKPLQLIQIEEKAIEELLVHYKAKDNPLEYITVRRNRDTVSCPVWKKEEQS